MVAEPFKNLYNKRQVAASSARACFICYKPTTTVLVSSDGKSDFFYACEGHLTDGHFASPQADPEVEKAKKDKEALQKQIELLEKQWKERSSDKQKKDDKKDDKKDSKQSSSEQDQNNNNNNNELERLEEIINRKPRTFTLNVDIYKIRIGHYRDKQRSKQTAQMLAKPSLFPTVPTHSPESTPPPTTTDDS